MDTKDQHQNFSPEAVWAKPLLPVGRSVDFAARAEVWLWYGTDFGGSGGD